GKIAEPFFFLNSRDKTHAQQRRLLGSKYQTQRHSGDFFWQWLVIPVVLLCRLPAIFKGFWQIGVWVVFKPGLIIGEDLQITLTSGLVGGCANQCFGFGKSDPAGTFRFPAIGVLLVE